MVIKLYIAVSMKVLAENYKGIDFVRISKLPEEQKKEIALALPSENIIKILRENELLTDCIQYKHYEAWFSKQYLKATNVDKPREPVKNNSLKLALD